MFSLTYKFDKFGNKSKKQIDEINNEEDVEEDDDDSDED